MTTSEGGAGATRANYSANIVAVRVEHDPVLLGPVVLLQSFIEDHQNRLVVQLRNLHELATDETSGFVEESGQWLIVLDDQPVGFPLVGIWEGANP